MREPGDRALAAGALLLAAGVMFSYGALHADNNDAALYTLIVKRLAADRTPFALWFPPVLGVPPRPFYEHPPLFFWVEALALTVAPQLGLRLAAALCGVVTVGSAFVAGRAVLGARAAFLGCLVLVATDSFSGFQPLARLDPPLVAAMTGSVALIVTSRGRWGRVLAGGLVAGVGALVKGPPALGAPVIAAALLAASGERESLRRPACWVAGVAGAVALPAGFLLFDRAVLGGAWWRGYAIGQVYESALGSRRHGAPAWELAATFLGRFWPGLPLVAIALARAVAGRLSPAARRVRFALLGWGLLVFLGFMGRRYWFYLMPAYPGMALLAGAGLEDVVGSTRAAPFTRWAWRLATCAGAVLLASLPFGLFRAAFERSCLFGDLPARACALAGEGAVGVLPMPYSPSVIFAEHCPCATVAVTSFEAAAAGGGPAVVLSQGAAPAPAGWSAVATRGAFTLYAAPGAAASR